MKRIGFIPLPSLSLQAPQEPQARRSPSSPARFDRQSPPDMSSVSPLAAAGLIGIGAGLGIAACTLMRHGASSSPSASGTSSSATSATTLATSATASGSASRACRSRVRKRSPVQVFCVASTAGYTKTIRKTVQPSDVVLEVGRIDDATSVVLRAQLRRRQGGKLVVLDMSRKKLNRGSSSSKGGEKAANAEEEQGTYEIVRGDTTNIKHILEVWLVHSVLYVYLKVYLKGGRVCSRRYAVVCRHVRCVVCQSQVCVAVVTQSCAVMRGGVCCVSLSKSGSIQ